MGVALIFILDANLTPVLVARLHGLGDRVNHGERDLAAFRRPGEVGDTLVAARQLLGFAAGERDAVELPLAIAIRNEGEPRAIRRPRRLQARLLAVGELPQRPAPAEPQLGFVGVLLPVGFSDGECDLAAVRRDRRRAHAPEVNQVVNGRGGGCLRRDAAG